MLGLDDVVRLRTLCDTLLDIMGDRMRVDNRMKALKREGRLTDDIKDELKEILKILKQRENRIRRMIKRIIKDVPLYREWLSRVRGVGEVSVGILIAYTYRIKPFEDIRRFPTVSKYWMYCGWGVDPATGRAVRKTRGQKLKFRPTLKWITHVMAENMIMQRSRYRAIYLHYKDYYRQRGVENPTDMHIHLMARRKLITKFLQHFYMLWHLMCGYSFREPYVYEYKGHSGAFIPPLVDDEDRVIFCEGKYCDVCPMRKHCDANYVFMILKKYEDS